MSDHMLATFSHSRELSDLSSAPHPVRSSGVALPRPAMVPTVFVFGVLRLNNLSTPSFSPQCHFLHAACSVPHVPAAPPANVSRTLFSPSSTSTFGGYKLSPTIGCICPSMPHGRGRHSAAQTTMANSCKTPSKNHTKCKVQSIPEHSRAAPNMQKHASPSDLPEYSGHRCFLHSVLSPPVWNILRPAASLLAGGRAATRHATRPALSMFADVLEHSMHLRVYKGGVAGCSDHFVIVWLWRVVVLFCPGSGLRVEVGVLFCSCPVEAVLFLYRRGGLFGICAISAFFNAIS